MVTIKILMKIEHIGKNISFPSLNMLYSQIQLALNDPEKTIRHMIPIVEISFMILLLLFVLNSMDFHTQKQKALWPFIP